MTKLKAVLATAAALVLGGLGVYQAMTESGQTHEMGIGEGCKRIAHISDVQKQKTWFLAIPNGTEIPKAWPDAPDGRVLGNCADGVCQFGPSADHECNYYYTYKSSPLVNGYRMFEVRSHKYIAAGWRAWAKSTDAEAFGDRVYWWASFSSPLKGCINSPNMTNSQCLNILELDKRCLFLPDGRACRHGRLLGEDSACPYVQIVNYIEDPGSYLAWDDPALYPCTVYRGAGSERQDAFKDWEAEPEEFDEL